MGGGYDKTQSHAEYGPTALVLEEGARHARVSVHTQEVVVE